MWEKYIVPVSSMSVFTAVQLVYGVFLQVPLLRKFAFAARRIVTMGSKSSTFVAIRVKGSLWSDETACLLLFKRHPGEKREWKSAAWLAGNVINVTVTDHSRSRIRYCNENVTFFIYRRKCEENCLNAANDCNMWCECVCVRDSRRPHRRHVPRSPEQTETCTVSTAAPPPTETDLVLCFDKGASLQNYISSIFRSCEFATASVTMTGNLSSAPPLLKPPIAVQSNPLKLTFRYTTRTNAGRIASSGRYDKRVISIIRFIVIPLLSPFCADLSSIKNFIRPWTTNERWQRWFKHFLTNGIASNCCIFLCQTNLISTLRSLSSRLMHFNKRHSHQITALSFTQHEPKEISHNTNTLFLDYVGWC